MWKVRRKKFLATSSINRAGFRQKRAQVLTLSKANQRCTSFFTYQELDLIIKSDAQRLFSKDRNISVKNSF